MHHNISATSWHYYVSCRRYNYLYRLLRLNPTFNYNLFWVNQSQLYFSNVFYYYYIHTTCFGPYGSSSGEIYKLKFKVIGLSLRANYTDRRLPAKSVPTFVDGGCHVISVTDPSAVLSVFLDRNRIYTG
jgi:hypothetical protein